MSSRYRRRNINLARQQQAGIPPWKELQKMKRQEIDALLAAHNIESAGSLPKDRGALNKARG